MNFKKFLPISAMLLVVLMAGCNKDAVNGLSSMKTSADQRNNKDALASNIPGVNLGVAGEFRICQNQELPMLPLPVLPEISDLVRSPVQQF